MKGQVGVHDSDWRGQGHCSSLIYNFNIISHPLSVGDWVSDELYCMHWLDLDPMIQPLLLEANSGYIMAETLPCTVRSCTDCRVVRKGEMQQRQKQFCLTCWYFVLNILILWTSICMIQWQSYINAAIHNLRSFKLKPLFTPVLYP